MKKQTQSWVLFIIFFIVGDLFAKEFRSAMEEDYCPTPKICYCPPVRDCECPKTIDDCYRDFFDDYHPFMGSDFVVTYQPPVSSWQPILPKRYPAGTVYMGSLLNPKYPQLGFEIGLLWTPGAKRSVTLPAGSNFSGLIVGPNILTLAKVHLNEYYLDLQLYWSPGYCIDLFVGMGLGLVNPKFKVSAPNIHNSRFDDALRTLETKAIFVPRINAGACYMLTEVLGCRARIGWENTSRLRLRGKANFDVIIAPTLGRRVFADSLSLGLGLFALF